MSIIKNGCICGGDYYTNTEQCNDVECRSERIGKDNFEEACCWDEENNCVYGFESTSPTKMDCLGCGETWERTEDLT